ncbi:MAG TPA: ribosomal protein S18-alanine N-acetyltransferase [Candidatus Onthovivens sp.]|nr:ribosomal protein S18-alanine N-acetyltransferase [Candidatus Onthovivens sp.]
MIKLLDESYQEELYQLNLSSLKTPLSLKDIQYELKENPVSKILGYFDDDQQLVGFIDFWITFDSSTIYYLAVHPSFRKGGIATKLFREVFKILKEENVFFLTLEVRVSNLAAIKLYEKVGFEKVTIKENYYEFKEDAIYMVKGVV